MTKLVLDFEDCECTLEECPPGLFLWNETVCFKSEYKNEKGEIEAYNQAGEFFVGESNSEIKRNDINVQPLKPIWETTTVRVRNL